MKRLDTLLLLALVTMLAPAALDAQNRHGGGGNMGGGRGAHTPPPAAPPRSASEGISVDHPLPGNLNTVHPSPVLGFGPPPSSPFTARPGTYTRQHRPTYGSSIGGSGFFGYGTPYYDDTYAPPAPPQDEKGTLFVEVTPPSTMVFVDTAFVGSAEDVRTRGVPLSPGHHWLDLEASGYEKKTVEVTIAAGQGVRYQTDLVAARSASLVASPPHPPQTMYAIPGCYGGNTPPVQASLPKGCDIAKVRVLRPPQ